MSMALTDLANLRSRWTGGAGFGPAATQPFASRDDEAGGARHVLLLRFVVVQIAALAIVGLALAHGWVQTMLASDTTYLTHVIVATAAVGLFASLRVAMQPAGEGNLAFVRLIAYLLVPMGLVDTVVGFIIGLLGVDTTAAGDATAVGHMLNDVLHGMAIALYNTLVASVAHIWMRVNLYLILPGARRGGR